MLENIDRLITFNHSQTINIAISEEIHISVARRQAAALASNIGFDDTEINKISIIVNELGSNLIKHAAKNKQRMLMFQYTEKHHKKIFEIIAYDKGPGILNLAQCLQDGYSTTNTAGTGLGAIQRLADYFNVYSLADSGTVVLAAVVSQNKTATVSLSASLYDLCGLCLPKPGETISGDCWSYYQANDYLLLIVADGLGHGPEAAHASQLACEVFQKSIHLSPGKILYAIDYALYKTRGAAVSIAMIDHKQQQVIYAGLGNVGGAIYINNNSQQMVSHDGTVGISHRNVQEYRYPWNDKALLVLFSDGLMSRWSLKAYPGLNTKPPALITSVLCRDFIRGNDDMTVVCVKNNSTQQPVGNNCVS